MWWVNKFGSISGPYSDEQIRKLVQTNRLTRLHKISADKMTWMRLDESAFWGRTVSSPEDIELPSATLPGLKIGGDAKVVEASLGGLPGQKIVGNGSPEMKSPEGNLSQRVHYTHESRRIPTFRRRVYVVAGICVAIVFIIGISFLIGRNKFGRGDIEIGKTDVEEKNVPPVVPPTKGETKQKPDKAKDGVTFESVKLKVAIIQCEGGTGTGFFLRFDGKTYLVTNEHVARSPKTPVVTLIDGSTVRLGDLSIAEDRDLARYEVDGKYESFVIADNAPNNGDPVWVFGNSSGEGVITTLHGRVKGVGSLRLETDAEFVPGNSGSPIVDAEGKVIGVAAMLKNGAGGKDWTTAGTEFDRVRRFGIRFTGVRWNPIEKGDFERECAEMEAFEAYWELLIPYLLCMDVSDEECAKLKLRQRDVDRKLFGAHDEGFHDMLVDLSNALAGQDKSWSSWRSVLQRRDALVKELNAAIAAGDLSYNNAVKTLDDFDRKNDIRWEKVKARHREFIAKRKEALLMARTFLTTRKWGNPCIRHGYGADDKRGSVEWYLEGVQFFLDQNAQKLKDINAVLKQLEKGDEDEE